MNLKVKQPLPFIKRILRVLRNTFWAFLVLLISIVALLFSGPGNQILVYGANYFVPNLTVTTDGKPLLRGGKFSLNYHTEQVVLRIKNMLLDVRFYSCAQLCFETLSAELIDLNIVSTATEVQVNEAPAIETIRLPASIAVKRLSLKRFNFSQGDTNASIDALSARFNAYESDINIDKLAARKINIKLPEQPAEITPAQQVITLPKISSIHFVTPLNWLIADLGIEQLEFSQGQLNERLDNIKLKAEQQGSLINITQLSVEREDVTASAKGEVLLTDNNPLTLLVNIENHQHQLTNKLSGDFSLLTLHTELAGRYRAKLEFEASLLDDKLPFSFSLMSKHLELEVQQKQVTLDDAILNAKGDLTAFQYQLDTYVTYGNYPKLWVEGEGTGNYTQLNIQRLGLETPASNISLSGVVDWQQGVDASISVLSDKISIEEFESSIASDIALKAALNFKSSAQHWRLNVPELVVAGQINNAPLDANIVMAIDDQLKTEISTFTISSAQNTLSLSGEIDQQWDMHGNLNLVNPETIDSRLSGQGTANFDISGKLKTPSLNWSMALEQLAFEQYRVDQIISKGTVDFAQKYLTNIRIEAAGINLDEQSISHINLDAKGDLQAHSLQLALKSEQLNVDANLGGGLKQQRYSGQINQLLLKNEKINLSNQQAINFDYDVVEGLVNVEKHCWLGTNTSFCLDAVTASPDKGNIALNLTHFDLSVLSLVLPKTISSTGEIKGHLNAKWQQGKLLAIDSELHSSTINFAINESFIKTDVPVEQLYFKLKANEQAVALDTDIKSSVLGNIIGDIDISDIMGKRPLKGKLALQSLNFANLTGFSQQIDKLAGELNANVTLAGNAFSPQIQGDLNLTNLAFLAPWTPLFIEQGNIQVVFNDNSATLFGKIADNNKGSLTLEGNADWQKEPAFNARINGDNFKIALEPNVWFALSPNMTINYANQFADVKGKVHVVDGRVKIKALPEGAVSISDDELIIDAAKQQNKSMPIAYSLDLEVLIDDKVRIDSFGLRSKLKGDVVFKRVDNTPLIATGEIAVLEGEYRAFGQELLVENGQLIFNGPVDKPLLNVRAIRNPERTEDGVIAGVKLTGDVEEPRLEIFSNPKMDQAMALSYLLSGRALSETNSSSDGMLTQLLLARGLAKGEGSINKIGEAIGIDDVTLSSRGSGEDTKVEISGYVAPGIQVRYSIGIFDSMSEVAVRYQLLPRLYIEAISGLNDSLDILYKFDWD